MLCLDAWRNGRMGFSDCWWSLLVRFQIQTAVIQPGPVNPKDFRIITRESMQENPRDGQTRRERKRDVASQRTKSDFAGGC